MICLSIWQFSLRYTEKELFVFSLDCFIYDFLQMQDRQKSPIQEESIGNWFFKNSD